MAVAIVDERMLREPRLLVPRMQPLGPVKVDWSNPLARDMCFAWIANNPQRDLVKGRAGTGSGSSATVASQYGLARYCTSDAANAGDNFGIGPAITSNSFSILSFAAPITSTAGKALFGQRKGSANYSQILLLANYLAESPTSGYIEIYHSGATGGAASYAATNNAAVNGKPRVFLVSRINGTAGNIFVDGVDATATSSYAATGNVFESGQHVRINNIGDYSGTGFANTDPHWLTLAWNRALTPAEVAVISADPYQIFVPA